MKNHSSACYLFAIYFVGAANAFIHSQFFNTVGLGLSENSICQSIDGLSSCTMRSQDVFGKRFQNHHRKQNGRSSCRICMSNVQGIASQVQFQ
jgi:hypothetical protein